MPKRIFVSHSSHDDAARNFIDELRAVLTSEGYDVLVDRDGHRPGEAWTPELHRWLAECDAAILMFSPDALASDWVFKEATILTFRASVHRDVRLLPVRDPRVPTALFESKHWAPLQANLLQMIELTDVSGVAAAAKEAFGPARQILTPYEELWTAVVSVLSKFDPAFLASAVDKRCPAPLRARRGSPRRSRAEALTDWVLLDALRGMDGLYDLVETDLRIPIRTEGLRERILDLAEQVDPLWISRDTAEPFVVAPSSNRQPIAINGAHLKWYTIKCLLRRAGVEPAPRYLVSCDPAIQSAEQIRAVIRDKLQLASRDDEGSDFLEDEKLTTFIDGVDRPPIVCLLPPHCIDAALFKQLTAEFPNVLFVVQAGEDPAALDDVGAHMTVPRPLIDSEREGNRYRKFTNLKNAMAGGRGS